MVVRRPQLIARAVAGDAGTNDEISSAAHQDRSEVVVRVRESTATPRRPSVK
jgi:hypothetical protein